jgi:hypothetical protein
MQIITDQKQQENVEYFTYLGSIITNAARCTRNITSRIVMAKAALNRKKTPFTSNLKQTKEKIEKRYISSLAVHGPETWTRGRIDQK